MSLSVHISDQHFTKDERDSDTNRQHRTFHTVSSSNDDTGNTSFTSNDQQNPSMVISTPTNSESNSVGSQIRESSASKRSATDHCLSLSQQNKDKCRRITADLYAKTEQFLQSGSHADNRIRIHSSNTSLSSGRTGEPLSITTDSPVPGPAQTGAAAAATAASIHDQMSSIMNTVKDFDRKLQYFKDRVDAQQPLAAEENDDAHQNHSILNNNHKNNHNSNHHNSNNNVVNQVENLHILDNHNNNDTNNTNNTSTNSSSSSISHKAEYVYLDPLTRHYHNSSASAYVAYHVPIATHVVPQDDHRFGGALPLMFTVPIINQSSHSNSHSDDRDANVISSNSDDNHHNNSNNHDR